MCCLNPSREEARQKDPLHEFYKDFLGADGDAALKNVKVLHEKNLEEEEEED